MPAGAQVTREYLDAKLSDISRRFNYIMQEVEDIAGYFDRNDNASLMALPSTANPADPYDSAEADAARGAAAHLGTVVTAYNGVNKVFVDRVRGIGF